MSPAWPNLDITGRVGWAPAISRNGIYGICAASASASLRLDVGCQDHLAKFMVSSAISLAKSAGEPGSTVAPRLASRAWKLASARLALTCVFNLLMVSAGVFLGAPMPYQL